jgi:O-antigen ligase
MVVRSLDAVDELPTASDPSSARGAYAAFLAFMLAVFSNAAILIPPLAKVAPGKSLIAVAAAALAWSCLGRDRRFRLGLGAGGAALYLFFGILLTSPLWSMWPGLSVDAAKESLKYLTGFVVAANVLSTPARVRQAAAVLALATLFPAIGTVHSFLTGTNLVDGRACWIGIFANPNFDAYYLVMATPIALALRDSVPDGRRRMLVRAGWLGVVALYAAAVLLTQSRGGATGLGAVVLLWLLRSLARGRAAVGAVLAIGVALAMTPLSPLNRDETRATLAGEVDLSAQGRIDAWRTALRIVQDRPIGGVGAGAFLVGYERYAPGDAGPARAAHSSYALIAAELGVPALIVFVLAILAAMVALGRRKTALSVGVQTSLFGFLVCSVTGSYVFTWPLYFVLGLAAAIEAGN